jgi:plastocyanin
MVIITVIDMAICLSTIVQPSMAQQDYPISITSTGYTMPTLFITMGSTVTWRNDDSSSHTVTSGTRQDGPAIGRDFDSLDLATGQTFSFVFNTPGTFGYFDRRSSNTGQIIVR